MTRDRTITNEGGVISILQKVNGTGNRAEVVSKAGAVLYEIESANVFITVLNITTDSGSPGKLQAAWGQWSMTWWKCLQIVHCRAQTPVKSSVEEHGNVPERW